MAIRLRTVNGKLVALCAAETDEAPGDLYLHDGMHDALAAKFARDWSGQTVSWAEPCATHESQRLRKVDGAG